METGLIEAAAESCEDPNGPPALFDTHCHLYMRPMSEDVEATLSRAAAAGTRSIVVPGVDLETSSTALGIAHRHRTVWAGVGVHPGYRSGSLEEVVPRLVDMVLDPKAVAVGETGADLHHEGRESLEEQLRWMRGQARVASCLGRSMILHSREAEAEVVDSIREFVTERSPVILHCYTGPGAVAVRALRELPAELVYFGFAGNTTYPGAQALREVLSSLPRDRVLIETDAPFLAPQPVRGTPNEPANLRHTLEAVARTWGLAPAAAADILTANASRAFGLGGGHRRTDLVYRLGSSVYVNLTGRCNNDCAFCVRRFQEGIGGYRLRHDGADPPAESLRKALSCLPDGFYDEVVFCGYGEPTLRFELLGELARTMSSRGWRTRLNTNGLALSERGREAVRELVDRFDVVSVSLNSHDADTYSRVCRSSVADAWDRLLEFIRLCVESECETRLSAVRYPGIDEGSVRRKAAELGAPLRMRG